MTSGLRVRVARKTVEAQGICSFELVAADGSELPAFDAGAHIDVHLGDGLVRQYSLCNNPRESHRYRLAVLRDGASRGGSVAISEGPAARKLDPAAIVAAPGPQDHLYVCGPWGFMEAVLAAARAAGWADDTLHREFFAAGPTTSAQDRSFEIVIASTGAAIRVAPHQTAIEALAAAGIEVPMSCEQGVCGTCLTRVLEGTPDHRDVYLTDREHARGDCFTPCCSRAKSPRLVLGL